MDPVELFIESDLSLLTTEGTSSLSLSTSTGVSQQGSSKRRKVGTNLTSNERQAVLHHCLKNLGSKERPKNGTFGEAANRFNCNRKTVAGIWKLYKKTVSDDLPAGDIESRMKETGRKKRHTKEELSALIGAVPHKQRSTMRDLSNAINIPMTTLYRYLKDGLFKKFNVKIKPFLTPEKKIARVNFCLSYLNEETGRFDPMYNTVHIDEKWFYIKKHHQRVYLTEEEYNDEDKVPVERGHKRFGTKVMFLCAVARPRWDTDRNAWFDGKLGIWPFVELVPALRDSKNRRAGTLETKPLNITAEIYKQMILEKVFPAIKENWPSGYSSETIWINEDNCRCHPEATRIVLQDVAAMDGWDIRGRPQPPNSPDLNVLDLGFFHSIQSLQYKTRPKNIDDLIVKVEESFSRTPRQTLDNVFMSLQDCMIGTLERGGDNTYKLKHSSKNTKKNSPALPYRICPEEAIDQGRDVLGGPCMAIQLPKHPLLLLDVGNVGDGVDL